MCVLDHAMLCVARGVITMRISARLAGLRIQSGSERNSLEMKVAITW